jgi:P4 family phage/plasmid primase-like protien
MAGGRCSRLDRRKDSTERGLSPMNFNDLHSARVNFLKRIHPNGTLVLVSLRNSDIRDESFKMPQQIEEASGWAARENNEPGRNVYFAVNSVKEGVHTRPKKSDVEFVSWLHLDLDPDMSDGYEMAKKKLQERLVEIKNDLSVPTFVVNSGNGLQIFFQLEEPKSIEEGEVLNRALVECYGGDPGTYTADRLMRLPGTLNYPTKTKLEKGYPPQPTMASIQSESDTVLTKQLETKLLNLRPQLLKTGGGVTASMINNMTKHDFKTALERLNHLLVEDPKLKDRWNGSRVGLNDTSGSGKDMSVMSQLRRHGFTFEESTHILDEFEHGSKSNKEAGIRDRYYSRMWQKLTAETNSCSSGHVHLDIALDVLEQIGADNLFFYREEFWQWGSEQEGVWSPVSDRSIKQRIQRTCMHSFEGNLTRSPVDSIFQLLANEIHKEFVPFDSAGDTINLLNGEIQFQDSAWEVTPHDRTHYRTSCIPVAYDSEAKAPKFEMFLDQVFAGARHAESCRQLVLEMMGYSLLPTCRFEKFVILYGSGANGKSVLLRVLQALVGPKNVSSVQPSQLRDPFSRAHLRGKLANIVSELSVGMPLADGELKAIVSGEAINAAEKYKSPFEFSPVATFWFAANSMPRLRDFSEGMVRRAEIVEFPNQFSNDQRDTELDKKLMEELPGILNLALDAIAQALTRGSIIKCQSSEENRQLWLKESDQVRLFIDEMCVVHPTQSVEVGKLYRYYKVWAEDSGIRQTLNKQNFGVRLDHQGIMSKRGSKGVRIRQGIGLPDIPAPLGQLGDVGDVVLNKTSNNG